MNRALLLSFALLTAILIMTGSYLIIRYVVVKPVKHLKAVSDAIVGRPAQCPVAKSTPGMSSKTCPTRSTAWSGT